MYRLDFHSHTGHSRDSALPAAALLRDAVRAGVNVLCVTDHDTIDGGRQAASIARVRADEHPGLTVIVGEEVMSSEGEIIGLFLTETIAPGLPPAEVAKRIRGQGGIVTVPHPFDRLRGSRLHEGALRMLVEAGLVDAIEARNARVTFPADNDRAVTFARDHGLPMVGGSDAHMRGEAGAAYAILDVPPATDADGLRAQLPAMRLGGGLSNPVVHLGSAAARWGRRLGFLPEKIIL